MKVELCIHCSGRGVAESEGLGRNPEIIKRECKHCNGTGRIMVAEYRLIMPYNSNVLEIGYYEVDKQINDLLRDFNMKEYD
jgi:hypothetical protein